MLTRLAAVFEDVGVLAPGVLQSVSEDRQAVERMLLVDAYGKRDDCRREPRRVNRDGAEGKWAEQTSEQEGARFAVPSKSPARMRKMTSFIPSV
jgi:hypothetical protein